MKDYKNRTLNNEEGAENLQGSSFENSNTVNNTDERQKKDNLNFPFNNDPLFKRYSFDDNGGGYQGL